MFILSVKITSLFSGILRSDWSQFKDEFRVKDAACLYSGRATVSPLYLQLDHSYSDVPMASPLPTDLPQASTIVDSESLPELQSCLIALGTQLTCIIPDILANLT